MPVSPFDNAADHIPVVPVSPREQSVRGFTVNRDRLVLVRDHCAEHQRKSVSDVLPFCWCGEFHDSEFASEFSFWQELFSARHVKVVAEFTAISCHFDWSISMLSVHVGHRHNFSGANQSLLVGIELYLS